MELAQVAKRLVRVVKLPILTPRSASQSCSDEENSMTLEAMDRLDRRLVESAAQRIKVEG